MHIGIGGLMHETHTFLPDSTGTEPFEQETFRGTDLIDHHRDTNTAIGGFLDVCAKEGADVHPTLATRGGISGTVEEHVYDEYVGEMRSRFEDVAEELDGVLLFLHGAMVTEERPDPETDVVEGIRDVVGDIPIVVGMDLHGNIDPEITDAADAVSAYRSSPHVDKAEAGRRAARLLFSTLSEDVSPSMAISKPGLVIPSPFSATTISPAKDVIERSLGWQIQPELNDVTKWDRRGEILDVSFFFGFAWSDVPQLGASAVVVTDDDEELAQEIADDLADFAWERRVQFTDPDNLYTVPEGVEYAIDRAETADKPIVVLDAADRLAETTYVLRELLEQDATNVAFPLLYDPEAVEACFEAGEGNEVKIEVGSQSSPRGGDPVPIEGTVEWAGHITYTATGPISGGIDVDNGPVAIVDVDGVWLQLTSNRDTIGLIDTDPIEQYGHDATDFDIIVSKSKTHFRAVYEDLGEEIVIVDAPEYSPADLSVFDYENVPDGVYPITQRPEPE